MIANDTGRLVYMWWDSNNKTQIKQQGNIYIAIFLDVLNVGF